MGVVEVLRALFLPRAPESTLFVTPRIHAIHRAPAYLRNARR